MGQAQGITGTITTLTKVAYAGPPHPTPSQPLAGSRLENKWGWEPGWKITGEIRWSRSLAAPPRPVLGSRWCAGTRTDPPMPATAHKDIRLPPDMRSSPKSGQNMDKSEFFLILDINRFFTLEHTEWALGQQDLA